MRWKRRRFSVRGGGFSGRGGRFPVRGAPHAYFRTAEQADASVERPRDGSCCCPAPGCGCRRRAEPGLTIRVGVYTYRVCRRCYEDRDAPETLEALLTEAGM